AVNDGSASNGQFIEVPNGQGSGGGTINGNIHQAEFCFTITDGGTYRLVGSVWGRDGGSNSFWVTVDGQPANGYKWTLPINTGFSDDILDDGGEVELSLAPGDHTVILYLRENGSRIDTIRLEQIGGVGNQAPTLNNPGNQTSQVGQMINLSLTATDPDNDPLTFSATGLPDGLSIDANTGLISGTPTMTGTYNVTATVSDIVANEDQQFFTWIIDDAPNGCGFLMQEAEVAILSGDFVAVNDGSASNGQFIEVPNGQGSGGGTINGNIHQAEFCFTITDGGTYRLVGSVWGRTGGSNSFWVTVDGQPANGYKWTLPINTGFSDDILDDGGEVELSLAPGDHTVILYLRENGSRIDTIRLEQIGGIGPNETPVLDPISDQVVTEGSLINFTATASDNEGDVLTFSLSNAPAGATIGANDGFFNWQTDEADGPGVYSATVVVSDGESADNQIVQLTVNEVNVAPVLDTIPDQIVTTGDDVSFTATASDSDIPAQSLTYSLSNAPAGATINAVSGLFDWTTPPVGSFSTTVIVSDGVLSDSQVVQITVNDQATNPVYYFSSSTNGSVDGVTFRDEDVTVYDPSSDSWAMLFDGSDVGLSGVDVDAFDVLPNGDLLLSVDQSVSLAGLGQVEDADIVQFTPTSLGATTAGSFSLYFDGSDVSLTNLGEGLDAINLTAQGNLIISTRGYVNVGTFDARDEDFLQFVPTSLGSNTSGTWQLYLDGSTVNMTDGREDISAGWVDDASGDVYLSTNSTYNVTGLSGDGDDIFICSPNNTNPITNCTFSLFWDGDSQGYANENIDAFVIVTPGAQNRPALVATDPNDDAKDHTANDDQDHINPDDEDGDGILNDDEDLNGDGNLENDDSDADGIPDYLDHKGEGTFFLPLIFR
ncbi:MAG: putative Ig domain-containing protein, partial [Chloroflexota bacterium]